MEELVTTREKVCIHSGAGGRSVCYFEIDREAYEQAPGDPGRNEGKYALTDAAEDWAESFASFVYPQYWQSFDILVQDGIRFRYIEDQIMSIQ